MQKVLHVILVLIISCSFASAEVGATPPLSQSSLAAQGESLPVLAIDPSVGDDNPEEPDFAFIAGGPYTQMKNSIQFIFPTQWGRRRSNVGGSILQHAEFGTLLRTEWGLTDRWELDVIFSGEGERDLLGQRKLTSNFAFADAVLGA